MAATDPAIELRESRRRSIDWSALAARRLPGLIAFAALIAAWQLLIVISNINPILFPPPAAVLSELWEVIELGLLQAALIDSMYALAVGLALSVLVGVPIGLFLGTSSVGELLTYPYLWAFFATPRIALAPLMVLWFGFGSTTKIWLVFLSAVVPLMLSCMDGVKTTDPTLTRAAISFCSSRLALFTKVIAPYTLPFIASGIRNGISRGFVGLLVIEMTVGSGGLGTEVMRAMRGFNTARMFAFVLVLVVLALSLIGLSKRLEAYASRWREDVAI